MFYVKTGKSQIMGFNNFCTENLTGRQTQTMLSCKDQQYFGFVRQRRHPKKENRARKAGRGGKSQDSQPPRRRRQSLLEVLFDKRSRRIHESRPMSAVSLSTERQMRRSSRHRGIASTAAASRMVAISFRRRRLRRQTFVTEAIVL